MEHNFDNRDFERFVRQNADQYRMFPSEKVWGEIHATLHTRKRRWYLIGLSLLFITTITVTAIMLLQNNRKGPGMTALHQLSSYQQESGPLTEPTATAGINAVGPVQTKNTVNPFIQVPVNTTVTTDAADNNEPTDQAPITAFFPINSQSAITASLPVLNNSPATATVATASATQPEETAKLTKRKGIQQPALTNTVSAPATNPVNNIQSAIAAPVTTETTTAPAAEDKTDLTQLPLIPSREAAKEVVKLKTSRKPEWQLYFTPTVSYRSLSENMEYLSAARYNSIVNGGNAVIYPTDVNTMVNHRPDLGFQLGLRSAIPFSPWFKFTAGIQLSVSKYDIKAYQHPAEMATIALTDRSVSTVSNYRNTNGYKENWLRNFYFSASIPVGLELKLSDGTKNYFGIAGTLQPTYVLDNRAYLITSDYKNYAEMPSLTRRWNMNTSFEVFTQQRTGKLNWRVGPQVRYQLMSSFSKDYPIKEHLFDFGLKLGIQL